MSDHINVQHPDNNSENWRHLEQMRLLETRLAIAEMRITELSSSLGSIFTRVRRGDICELHYKDGTVLNIVAADQ